MLAVTPSRAKPASVRGPQQLRVLDAIARDAGTARAGALDRVEDEGDGAVADGVHRHADPGRPRGCDVRIEPLGGDAHDAGIALGA